MAKKKEKKEKKAGKRMSKKELAALLIDFCLRGRRKNKIYSLGDAITVRVARANLEKKQLDFELIEK